MGHTEFERTLAFVESPTLGGGGDAQPWRQAVLTSRTAGPPDTQIHLHDISVVLCLCWQGADGWPFVDIWATRF